METREIADELTSISFDPTKREDIAAVYGYIKSLAVSRGVTPPDTE